jgi:hypothetical protein
MRNYPVSWAIVVAVALGCTDGRVSDEGLSTPCSPNAQVACTCADGKSGVALCSPTGSAVGTCSCAPATTTGGSSGLPNPTGTGGRAPTVLGTGGSPSTPPAATGGQASQPPSNGSASSGGSSSAPVSSDLPCEVQAIIGKNCATCHSNPTKFGAPIPFVTATDIRSAGQRVLARVEDDALPMPPPPNARLLDSEIKVLKDWIDAGAPAGACTVDPPIGKPNPEPTEELPPDVTCYTLTARQSAGGAKYSVPETPDLYQCFDYTPPWGDKVVQVVAARPIIDNDRVLHHWILYNRSADVTDGTNATCFGAHPDASFITGWAPGGDGMHLPADVGLRTEGGGFTLEIHYNNSAGAGQLDASGVEVCVTEKLRPKEAAVHWLGTQSLNKLTATGTCTPVNTQPVTILTSSPHMHLQGRHMKTVINRKGGGTETLIDEPFDFNTQISYDTPAVIQPGDTLTTTCTFATPTPFGQKTNEEMCYNFVIAYPAGQLAQFLQILRKYDCTGL